MSGEALSACRFVEKPIDSEWHARSMPMTPMFTQDAKQNQQEIDEVFFFIFILKKLIKTKIRTK